MSVCRPCVVCLLSVWRKSPSSAKPEGLFSFAVGSFDPAAFFVASSSAPSAATEDRSIFLLPPSPRLRRDGGHALRGGCRAGESQEKQSAYASSMLRRDKHKEKSR